MTNTGGATAAAQPTLPPTPPTGTLPPATTPTVATPTTTPTTSTTTFDATTGGGAAFKTVPAPSSCDMPPPVTQKDVAGGGTTPSAPGSDLTSALSALTSVIGKLTSAVGGVSGGGAPPAKGPEQKDATTGLPASTVAGASGGGPADAAKSATQVQGGGGLPGADSAALVTALQGVIAAITQLIAAISSGAIGGGPGQKPVQTDVGGANGGGGVVQQSPVQTDVGGVGGGPAQKPVQTDVGGVGGGPVQQSPVQTDVGGVGGGPAQKPVQTDVGGVGGPGQFPGQKPIQTDVGGVDGPGQKPIPLPHPHPHQKPVQTDVGGVGGPGQFPGQKPIQTDVGGVGGPGQFPGQTPIQTGVGGVDGSPVQQIPTATLGGVILDNDDKRWSAKLTAKSGDSVELWGDPHVIVNLDGKEKKFDIGFGAGSITLSSGNIVSWDTYGDETKVKIDSGRSAAHVLRNFSVDSLGNNLDRDVTTMDRDTAKGSGNEMGLTTALTEGDIRELAAKFELYKGDWRKPLQLAGAPDKPLDPPSPNQVKQAIQQLPGQNTLA